TRHGERAPVPSEMGLHRRRKCVRGQRKGRQRRLGRDLFIARSALGAPPPFSSLVWRCRIFLLGPAKLNYDVSRKIDRRADRYYCATSRGRDPTSPLSVLWTDP